MRRFTPPAASRAIGNYRTQFAVADIPRCPQNPDLAETWLRLGQDLAET
jgi:hypothetical protein